MSAQSIPKPSYCHSGLPSYQQNFLHWPTFLRVFSPHPTWAPLNSTVGLGTPGLLGGNGGLRCLSRVKHTIQDRLPWERHSKSFAAPGMRHGCWHAQVTIQQVTNKTTKATESSNARSSFENSSSSSSWSNINSYEQSPNHCHSPWHPSPINSK